MDPFEYRDALPEDEDTVVGIWWGMMTDHLAYDPRWYANKGEDACKSLWREHLGNLLREEGCTVVVATLSGTPVGFLLARITLRPPIFELARVLTIDSTAVLSDHRGRGVFRGMLSHLEKKARDAGIEVLDLRVQVGNPAQRAYEHTGFVSETLGMIKWMD